MLQQQQLRLQQHVESLSAQLQHQGQTHHHHRNSQNQTERASKRQQTIAPIGARRSIGSVAASNAAAIARAGNAL